MNSGYKRMQTLLQNQKLAKAYKAYKNSAKTFESWICTCAHKLTPTHSYVSVSYYTISVLLSWSCMTPGGKRVKYFYKIEIWLSSTLASWITLQSYSMLFYMAL